MKLTRRGFLGATLGAVAVLANDKVLGFIYPNEAGLYTVDLSQFPSLANQWGSVQLNDTHNKINPGSGTEFDSGDPVDYYIALTRTKSGSATDSFAAVHSRCPHKFCSVSMDFKSSQMHFDCHCHNSFFQANGTVVKGPATSNLKKYTCTYDDSANTVTINIPEWTNDVADPKQATVLRGVYNYPNPFSATTNIVFELAKAGNVTIDVYTIDGKLIQHALDERRDAGLHTIAFDASTLANGQYHYSITTAEENVVGVMQVSR